ncbi:Myo-inositol transporter 2 [Rhodotorula toruloides]|uniref:General substrate transporter n=1 Tax=Rhodotorula toruloides TaxID=5286 RepID=A0A0K3CAN8_RHOTO|nr:Myo-inositol transporter 2 [Rhodotorula toruloides]PRQ76020.1 general substrate transporter [Rhodotorula toruloides]
MSSTPPAPLLGPDKAPSTRSNSSGELDFDKLNNKATLKHLSQSRLEVDESVVRAEGEERTTFFVWWLVIAAATGGLLFGYDTGVIGGALVHKDVASDLHRVPLGSFDKELLTSATTLGALIAGFSSGVLADIIGRKIVIGLADAIFIIGAVLQAVSYGANAYWIMAVGRLIIGFGVGLASLVVPLYIGELSPTSLRGRLVTLNVVAITGGQVIAYCLNLAFQNVTHGWRFMVGLGAIPPALQLLMLIYLPESPRFLLRHDKLEATVTILRKIYPYATEEQLHLKADVISKSVKENMGHRATFVQTWKRLHLNGPNFRALVVACGLQGIQQLCGFNTLMYYAPTLFQSVGFDNSLVIGLVISIVNLVFTIVALFIIDRVGRRRIACSTVPGMCGALILAAVAFHFLTIHTGGKLPDNGAGLNDKWSPVVLTAMLVYVAFYATGIGNIPWQQGELFEMDVRGMGTALSTTCNWGGNLIIGSTFLSLIDRITAAGAFGFYAGLCFLGSIFVFFLYPETSGLSLEETREVFLTGFGIRKANRMRKQKMAALAQVRDADDDATV